MVSVDQIRNVVAQYVEHKNSDKFLIEFSKLSYNIHKTGDHAAVDLSRKVQGVLSLAHAHGWLASKMREELGSILADSPEMNGRCIR